MQKSSLVILQLNLQTPSVHTQPAPSDRGTQESSLTLLFPGNLETCSAGLKRAYDEKAEQKKPMSTGAFWEEQHVSIVLPAAGFS